MFLEDKSNGEIALLAPVSPDFTVAELLAWARTKPAGERYDYCNARRCALAQFGLETGRPHLVGVLPERIPHRLKAAVQANGNRATWTFGAFADRLARLAGE